jgi:hypothetical protein
MRTVWLSHLPCTASPGSQEHLPQAVQTSDLRSCQLDKPGPDALPFQFRKHRIDKNGGIAVLMGTAVECNNLHDQFL